MEIQTLLQGISDPTLAYFYSIAKEKEKHQGNMESGIFYLYYHAHTNKSKTSWERFLHTARALGTLGRINGYIHFHKEGLERYDAMLPLYKTAHETAQRLYQKYAVAAKGKLLFYPDHFQD